MARECCLWQIQSCPGRRMERLLLPLLRAVCTLVSSLLLPVVPLQCLLVSFCWSIQRTVLQLVTMKSEQEVQRKNFPAWVYMTMPRIIFFTIVVSYLLFGATVLRVLEGNDDDDEDGKGAVAPDAKSASSDLKKVVEQLWDDSQNEEISEEEWKKRTRETIEKIDADDDDDEDEQISWTFVQSFLYVTATLTRIGSTVQPDSFGGRLFALVYTLIGVPLLLIFFADLGKILVNLLQDVVETLQEKVKTVLFPTITTPEGDIDSCGFVLAVTAMLTGYVVTMSLLFRMWCGGSIFGNIYKAFLIVFGVGPAPIEVTEQCASFGVFGIVPTVLIAISAPVAWSLTNMQTDVLGTEYIRKIHTCLNFLKKKLKIS